MNNYRWQVTLTLCDLTLELAGEQWLYFQAETAYKIASSRKVGKVLLFVLVDTRKSSKYLWRIEWKLSSP
jgi:hypothetical protein